MILDLSMVREAGVLTAGTDTLAVTRVGTPEQFKIQVPLLESA